VRVSLSKVLGSCYRGEFSQASDVLPPDAATFPLKSLGVALRLICNLSVHVARYLTNVAADNHLRMRLRRGSGNVLVAELRR
jgi:hypothetical protein